MIRLYLVPMETIIDSRGRTIRRPKYITTMGVSVWEMHDYGQEPVCLLGADVTPEQHTALIANADVAAFPTNFDLRVGTANLASVQNELEVRNLPGDMVTAQMTYRKILRGIIAIFSISANTPLFVGGVTIDTTLGELSVEVRQQLSAAATSAGYSVEGLTLSSTIREALMKAVVSAGTRSILGLAI